MNGNGMWRHELKYVCSEAQLILANTRINRIMQLDKHIQTGSGYIIRSLYFDDAQNSCYFENEDGVDSREKYRIRIYNQSSERISLEIKKKLSGKTQKLSCLLTEEQCSKLMSGETPEFSPDYPLALRKLCMTMQLKQMRPKVIVEYNRSPYVYRTGNVRVTFDRNISASSNIERFLDNPLETRPVMPINQHVLEVKFDEFLPDIIYGSLQLENLQRTAYSKYYICRRYTNTAARL